MHIRLSINAASFAHNIQVLQTYSRQQLIYPVIKAEGYGHGLKEMVQLCAMTETVHGICVVSLHEAVSARQYGFRKPILVLYTCNENLEDAVKYSITVTLTSVQQARILAQYAQKYNVIMPIHVEIDTGLSRSGISYKNAVDEILAIAQEKYIHIDGIYTHMIMPESESTTIMQKQRLEAIYKMLHIKGIIIPHVHYANSGVVIMHGARNSTLVRPGIACYGIPASDTIKTKLHDNDISLKQIMSISAPLLETRVIDAGQTVGYDLTYRATKKTIIGLVPIGYADGYARALSNRALVRIGNSYAPVVGLVSMNFIMIDITHIPTQLLSDVTLVDDDPRLSIASLAKQADMSPYELTTRFTGATKERVLIV